MQKPNGNKSRYELFCENALSDFSKYEKELKSDGSFNYSDQVTQLQLLSNKINLKMLKYLFGDFLGTHLAEKYAIECNRNLLTFFSAIDSQYKFYILYELKNNEDLFFHC